MINLIHYVLIIISLSVRFDELGNVLWIFGEEDKWSKNERKKYSLIYRCLLLHINFLRLDDIFSILGCVFNVWTSCHVHDSFLLVDLIQYSKTETEK